MTKKEMALGVLAVLALVVTLIWHGSTVARPAEKNGPAIVTTIDPIAWAHSLPPCAEEDGTGPADQAYPCAWVSSRGGNKTGAISLVYSGPEDVLFRF